MAKKNTNDHGTGMLLYEAEALAGVLLPEI